MMIEQGRLSDGCPTRLQTACETRWNTQLNVLRSLYNLREPLEQTITSYNFKKPKKTLPVPTAADWKIINVLITLLKPFESFTDRVGGDEYPTLGLSLVLLRTLLRFMSNFRKTDDYALVKTFFDALRSDLEERFRDWPDAARIAIMCDPRYKCMIQFDQTQQRKAKQLFAEGK